MPKLKDILTTLAKKAGIDTNADAHKLFFENPAFPDFDIPETLATDFDNKLLSIADAKNNYPEIKNFYTYQALTALDGTMERVLQELGYGDDVKSEIFAEKSSYKRVELLAEKIKELETKKVPAGAGKDVAKQIDDLNAQLRAEKMSTKTLKETHDKELQKFRIQSQVANLISRVETIYDDTALKISPTVRETTIRSIIENELMQKKAKFAFDESGQFTLVKDDGTNFYDEKNTQIFPVQFIEKALATANVLKVSKQPAAPAGNNTQPIQTTQGKTDKQSAAFAELAKETLNDLKRSSAAMPNGI